MDKSISKYFFYCIKKEIIEPISRHIILDAQNKTIDLLFSNEHIKLCINKNKLQDINLEKEIIKKDIEIRELKVTVAELKKKNIEHDINDKLIYVVQTCLNMQTYINLTGWNKKIYRKFYEQQCGNNYNEFKEEYPEYSSKIL